MTVTDTAPLPIPCRSCGEPLFTRALVCPHCGAADPAGEPPAAEAEPVLGFEPLTPRRVVVDVPAAAAQTAEAPATDEAATAARARLWPEAGEADAPEPDLPAEARDDAEGAPTATGAVPQELVDPAPVDLEPVDPTPVDLEPVVWRSAAAAQAEPIARAAIPLPDETTADAEPTADVGTTAAPLEAMPDPVETPAAAGLAGAASQPGGVAGTATPAAAEHEVRPPDAQPTVDRFDEIMAASGAAAAEGRGPDGAAGAAADGDLHGEFDPPRKATAESRLDIAPRRDAGGGGEPPSARDLVLVPERGGRELGPPRRRSARMLAGSLLILLFIALGAAGALVWRQFAPLAEEATAPPPQVTQLAQAEPAEIAAGGPREIALTRAWAPLDLGTPPPGGWAVSASGPFRIRVDGAVYTVSGPVPFAVPLGGGNVEARAIGEAVTLTISGR